MSEITISTYISAVSIAELAKTMRESDRREVWALNRSQPDAALAQSVVMSGDEAYIVRCGDRVVAMFGLYHPVLGDTGTPWMLGSDLVSEHPRELLRITKDFTRHALTRCRVLRNHVHAENKPSIRYLRAAGFTIHEAAQVPTGAWAHQFTMERPDV